MKKLPPKQTAFVDEYLIDMNGTQAAIRAGYSARTAREQAVKLLAKPPIRELVSQRMQQRSEATKIDAAMVLRRHAEIDAMDVADIMDDNGALLPIREWPKSWRTTISGVEVMEMMGSKSDDEKLAVLRKIKWPDKLRNLELLGRHTNVGAYRDNGDSNQILQVVNNITIADRSDVPAIPGVYRSSD